MVLNKVLKLALVLCFCGSVGCDNQTVSKPGLPLHTTNGQMDKSVKIGIALKDNADVDAASEVLWKEGEIWAAVFSEGMGWSLSVPASDVESAVEILNNAKRDGKLKNLSVTSADELERDAPH